MLCLYGQVHDNVSLMCNYDWAGFFSARIIFFIPSPTLQRHVYNILFPFFLQALLIILQVKSLVSSFCYI